MSLLSCEQSEHLCPIFPYLDQGQIGHAQWSFKKLTRRLYIISGAKLHLEHGKHWASEIRVENEQSDKLLYLGENQNLNTETSV